MLVDAPRDRPADDEIEITEEMIEAGASVLRQYYAYGADPEDLACMAFEAMDRVREAQRPHHNSRDVRPRSYPRSGRKLDLQKRP
jgi:hypothetical protein